MRAGDVMTERVLRATPGTTVSDIAQILYERQISALPVIDDDGRVVGIVTEGDLMRRPEIGTVRKQPGDLDSFAERTVRAAAYIKAHGLTAADVMTRHVVTVTKDTPLAVVAELMEKHRIKRVPVIDGGKLVGIVSRLDLVRAVTVSGLKEPHAPLNDEEIKGRLAAEIAREGWKLDPSAKIVVFEGVVHLFGAITSALEQRALATAARNVPGVREVQDHLEVREPRIEFG
jgi:CBS domain-containing protein